MQSVQTQGGRSDRNGGTRTRNRRARGDGGVALIEFAILAPVLFLVLFGIIEFGWASYQNIDVRHGAREGGRLAAVDYGAGDMTVLLTEICDRMDPSNTSGVDIAISKTGNDIGDEVTVTIRKPLDTLTGFLDTFLGGKTLTSTIKTRLEQEASFGTEPSESLPGNDCP